MLCGKTYLLVYLFALSLQQGHLNCWQNVAKPEYKDRLFNQFAWATICFAPL